MSQIRPFVLFVPMAVFIAAAVASLIDLAAFQAFAKSLSDWILAHFSTAIVWAVFGFVLTCVAVVVSPLGKVKIGGADAKPLLSMWNWFAITLCTTIATGILFWAMAEPVFHLTQPGGRAFEPGGAEAQSFALVSLYMHWSISPYAIYTVAGLSFALAYHNLGKRYSVSGPFSVLLGREPHKAVSSVLDASILLALVMGMAASMGAGMLLLGSGISDLTGLSTGPVMLAFVAAAIAVVVLISSVSGLLRGIRVLSDWNVRFFFVFIGFIFFFGPTREMFVQGGAALGQYALDFVPRSLFIGEAAGDKTWAFDWTIVYFANWLAWAPVTAMFLGRISRGYTVRAFVLVNLVLPSLFSLFWMSVFGVFAIETEAATGGALSTAMSSAGIEGVIFEALRSLPLTEIMVPFLLILAFVSYVTAADSNTEAIAQICRTHDGMPTEVDSKADDKELRMGKALKMVWVVLLAVTAWIMVAFSGIDGVRMLSNVGGLPALFIVIGLQLSLFRMMGQVNQLDGAHIKTVAAE